MQISSKLLARTAIVMLGVLLATMVFVVANNSQQANATNTSDLAIVQQYVDAYVQRQIGAGGSEGEDGFMISAASLNSRINSVNDAAILGEGDDAAGAPVLVDNYSAFASYLPGTTNRCFWNTGATATGVAENCFNTNALSLVRAKADAHANAGFSTDIVVYCVSGHTEAPTTGAFGYIAQTGLLRSDGSVPNVYALKWGRNGWTNTAAAYGNTGPLLAAGGASSYTPPLTVPGASACNSSAGNAELVRCQAQWAIYSGTVNGMTGGNVSNGQTPVVTTPYSTANPNLNAGQLVDIRTGSPATSVSLTGKPTVNIPVGSLFNTGLANVNSGLAPGATGVLVVSRTPMMGGIIAEGLKMLGEPMATGGFLNGGVPKWNNTANEKQVSDGLTRAAVVPNATPIDAIAPTISSGPTVSNITGTSADVARVTSEPATSKIHLVGNDSHVVDVNNTVLNANKTVSLSGLHAGVTYTGTLTAYDGQANGSSAAVTFATTAPNTPPVVTVPADITTEATGSTGAAVSFSASATDAEDGAITPVCTSASGSTFALGITSVSCTATDSGGLSDTKSFNVTVSDTTAPALSLPADITVHTTDAGGAAVSFSATANDVVDGAVAVISTPASGSTFAIGTTVVSNTATDAAGNVANGSFNVTVILDCVGAKPTLSIATHHAFWASFADYSARELSVRLIVSNSGATGTAYSAAITGASANNGVTLSTATPVALGDIAGSASATTDVKYHVPTGVTGFISTISGSASDVCGTGYTYP